MNTEAFNILMIDLERVVKNLSWVEVFDSHDSKLTKKNRIAEARRIDNDLQECKAELEYILDAMQQLKNNAA